MTNALTAIPGPSLIVRPTTLPPWEGVHDVIQSLPASRAFVIVLRQNDIIGWVWRLRSMVDRPVLHLGSGRTATLDMPFVGVGTEATLKHLTWEWCDILIVPDAAPMLQSVRRGFGLQYGGFPTVGFLTDEPEWGRLKCLRARQWFGGVVTPEMVGLPDIRTSVAVVTAPSVTPVIAGVHWRDWLWSEPDRVKFIAGIVTQCASDPTSFADWHPLPSATVTELHVALLVEQHAHAMCFSELLAGWTVLSARNDTVTRRVAIVTDAWRAAHPEARFDIVIDARSADPLLPPIVARGGLLVDIRDAAGPELERRHCNRLRAYSYAGLVVRPAA